MTTSSAIITLLLAIPGSFPYRFYHPAYVNPGRFVVRRTMPVAANTPVECGEYCTAAPGTSRAFLYDEATKVCHKGDVDYQAGAPNNVKIWTLLSKMLDKGRKITPAFILYRHVDALESLGGLFQDVRPVPAGLEEQKLHQRRRPRLPRRGHAVAALCPAGL